MVASFIPDSYVPPSSGGAGRYIKFEEGKSVRIRILSDTPLMGWVYWTTDNKPARSLSQPTNTANAKVYDDGRTEKPRHFWAMAVWEYGDKEIKILEVTQASIREEITKFAKSPEYGHPRDYDITITRRGKGLETKYEVIPARSNTPIPAEAEQAINENPINLNALLVNGDPFNPPSNTPASTVIDFAIPKRIKGLIKLTGVDVAAVKAMCHDSGLPASSDRYTNIQQLLLFRAILFSAWAEEQNADMMALGQWLTEINVETMPDDSAWEEWQLAVASQLAEQEKSNPTTAADTTPPF